MLKMRAEKRQMTKGIKLLNQEKIKTLGEQETYKYMGILEEDTIKQVQMKEKNFQVSQNSKPNYIT